MRTSWIRTGPLTLREIIRPLSFPSRMRTLTWLISPVTPVRPMTWIISAGVSSTCSAASFAFSGLSRTHHWAPRFTCSILPTISFINPAASPSLTIQAAPAGTSIPIAVPIFSLLGTYMYGIFLSSQRRGR